MFVHQFVLRINLKFSAEDSKRSIVKDFQCRVKISAKKNWFKNRWNESQPIYYGIVTKILLRRLNINRLACVWGAHESKRNQVQFSKRDNQELKTTINDSYWVIHKRWSIGCCQHTTCYSVPNYSNEPHSACPFIYLWNQHLIFNSHSFNWQYFYHVVFILSFNKLLES